MTTCVFALGHRHAIPLLALATLAAACPAPPASPCTTTAQCPPGFACDPGSGLCRVQAPDATATDHAPVDTERADGGPPEVAGEGRAREDGGATDGTVVDATAPDLPGLDATLPDQAIAPDVGGADSLLPDATPPDTAPADQGPGDVPPVDTSLEDALLPDAAQPDLPGADTQAPDSAAADTAAMDAAAAGPDAGGWDGAIAGYNLIFVSSGWVTASTLGGPAGADATCQQLASAAGRPGRFVAWISSSASSARERLGSARGFVRPDGLPFADTIDDLVALRVLYPPSLDQTGADLCAGSSGWGPLVLTGTRTSGLANETCQDWTSFASSEQLSVGWACAGGAEWTGGGRTGCDGMGRLYCIQNDQVRPLFGYAATGRLAFVSTGLITPGGGIGAADQLCAGEAANAGLGGTYLALLASDGASAASRLDPNGETWVRVDGVRLARTAADLLAGHWLAPNHLQLDGTPRSYEYVWSGAGAPDLAGSADTTCSSWTVSATGNGQAGVASLSNGIGFGYGLYPCTWSRRVYCLQE